MGPLIVAVIVLACGTVLVGRWIMQAGPKSNLGLGRRDTVRNSLAEHEFVDAVASFTEQMRDAVSGATGLEQAIAQAAETSPAVLRPQLTRLVASLRYGRTEDALLGFADELAHPTSDFVVAALLIAVRNETRDLGALLGHLSSAARDECRMHLRVWVSRSRLRSSVRTVTVAVAVFVFGLAVTNPAYLRPYAEPAGAAVLVLEALGFIVGLHLMRRLSTVAAPARLIGGAR
ncbi:MAG: type II secretion system F family protein [Acidimicrobiales bacterium]